jgi:molecular chaperone GrpE
MTNLNSHVDSSNPDAPQSPAARDENTGEGAAASAHANQANGASPAPADELSLLRRERDDLKNQILRAQADFANYQKRVKQQADEVRTYAVGNLAQDLLAAIDNLERAIEALRKSASPGITSGLDLVQKQLLDILAKYGVEPIAALDLPFDPNFHEAVMQQRNAEHPEGTVVAELGKGYKIHDRVLRPSKVAVSIKP